MRRTAAYGLAGLVALALAIGVLWPWVDGAARTGLLAAAATAWTVQVVAFGVLVRYRSRTTGFLAAWVGGTLVRLTLVLLAAWAVTRLSALEPAPTLLGLAGFLFGLLLLEPLFFGSGATTMDGA